MYYTIWELILFFFVYAFLGWALMVAVSAFRTGRFVNPGLLNGPVSLTCGIVVTLMAVLSTSYDATTTLELLHAEGQRLMLVDLLDGGVHELPESCRETLGHGLTLLKELPLRDYPLLLTVGDFVQWERER